MRKMIFHGSHHSVQNFQNPLRRRIPADSQMQFTGRLRNGPVLRVNLGEKHGMSCIPLKNSHTKS